MNSQALDLFTQTYRQPYRSAELRQAVQEQKAAPIEPADPYKEFILQLALKITNSPEEAEAAVQEMNADIKRCSEKGTQPKALDEQLPEWIAFRRLLKFLQ